MTAERERHDAEVPRTSIAERGIPPGEVTVRFSEWTPWRTTAYQKGQFAGFPRPEAERLVALGKAVIVSEPGPRQPVPRAPRRFGGG